MNTPIKRLAGLACGSLLAGVSLAESINILVEGGGEQLQKAVAAQFTEETGIEVNFTVVLMPASSKS